MELALLIWFASVSTGIAKIFGILSFIILVFVIVVVFFSAMWYLIEEEVLKLVQYKNLLLEFL